MKKFTYFLVVILGFLFVTPVFAEENSKINVHIFKSSTCPHCAEALEFFEELSKDPEYSKYFNYIPYETYGGTEEIQNNIKLAEEVARYFQKEFQNVPLIIIGDQKIDGYVSSINDQIKERIKTCYEEQCEDIVLGIKNGTLQGKPFELLIPVIIAVVVIGGISYFILLCSKPVSEDLVSESLEEETVNMPESDEKKKDEKVKPAINKTNKTNTENKKKINQPKKKNPTSSKKKVTEKNK